MTNPWILLAGYFVVGLALSLYFFVQEHRAKRSRPQGNIQTLPLKGTYDELVSPDSDVPLVVHLVAAIVWLPALLYVVVTERLEAYRVAKETAWRESPEGKAVMEREYREDIERSIQPWIGIEDLTQRNVPWSEFDIDYQESKTLFQRDRDQFEAFVAKFQAGDEMASFSTHEETWRRMFGRAGWAIVRDGRIVAQLITIMS